MLQNRRGLSFRGFYAQAKQEVTAGLADATAQRAARRTVPCMRTLESARDLLPPHVRNFPIRAAARSEAAAPAPHLHPATYGGKYWRTNIQSCAGHDSLDCP